MDTELRLKEFKEAHKTCSLFYVDYNDRFEPKTLHGIIQGTADQDWFDDDYEQCMYYLKEFFTEEEMDELDQDREFISDCIDHLREVDDSDPVSDCLGNTNQTQLIYYTGKGSSCSEEELRDVLTEMGIDLTTEKNAKAFSELQGWNFYGGDIQILFHPEPLDICKAIWNCKYGQDYSITFTDVTIGLADTSGGSGGYAEFDCTLTFPFIRENVMVSSESPGYDLTQVYGDSILGDSNWTIQEAEGLEKPEVDPKVAEYAKFDADLKKGVCSVTDPRFNSHDTEYINEYPCGHKCKKCGRFYID